MNYLLTAAGKGSRFLTRGIKPPKPLIRAQGRELLLWSLSSFKFTDEDCLYIVTQRKDRVPERMDKKIRAEYPYLDVRWFELDYLLNGQLFTALSAIRHFEIEGPLVIHNCDSYFDAPMVDSESLFEGQSLFGLVPCFRADGDHWSFFKTEDHDPYLVTDVAEKKRISTNCSIGTYMFRSTSEFDSLATEYIDLNKENVCEFYIAPVYRHAIGKGLMTKICPARVPRMFGTPAELMETFSMAFNELIAENAWDANQIQTLVVDIDDTICSLGPDKDYAQAIPNEPVCKAIRDAHAQGIYIVLATSRNMRTFRGSIGLINKYTAPVVLHWLDSNNIPYDEIHYAKPWGPAVSYLDDKAISIQQFIDISNNSWSPT